VTDFIESLEDDFGLYHKQEDLYRIVDEDLTVHKMCVLKFGEIECSKLLWLNGDSKNLSMLSLNLEVFMKVLKKDQYKHYLELAQKYDKKLLGLHRLDEKRDKYWLVECNLCFTRSSLRSRNFDSCSGCKTSKGEKRIARYLRDKKIVFGTQKTFKGLRYINPLKLDFYVPFLKTAIEFQGEQHTNIGYYIRMGVSNPEKALRDCQLRDQAKREWCKKNGIRLIEIHYYQFRKIEAILDKLLFGLAV
jgi:hypothetical protein